MSTTNNPRDEATSEDPNEGNDGVVSHTDGSLISHDDLDHVLPKYDEQSWSWDDGSLISHDDLDHVLPKYDEQSWSWDDFISLSDMDSPPTPTVFSHSRHSQAPYSLSPLQQPGTHLSHPQPPREMPPRMSNINRFAIDNGGLHQDPNDDEGHSHVHDGSAEDPSPMEIPQRTISQPLSLQQLGRQVHRDPEQLYGGLEDQAQQSHSSEQGGLRTSPNLQSPDLLLPETLDTFLSDDLLKEGSQRRQYSPDFDYQISRSSGYRDYGQAPQIGAQRYNENTDGMHSGLPLGQESSTPMSSNLARLNKPDFDEGESSNTLIQDATDRSKRYSSPDSEEEPGYNQSSPSRPQLSRNSWATSRSVIAGERPRIADSISSTRYHHESTNQRWFVKIIAEPGIGLLLKGIAWTKGARPYVKAAFEEVVYIRNNLLGAQQKISLPWDELGYQSFLDSEVRDLGVLKFLASLATTDSVVSEEDRNFFTGLRRFDLWTRGDRGDLLEESFRLCLCRFRYRDPMEYIRQQITGAIQTTPGNSKLVCTFHLPTEFRRFKEQLGSAPSLKSALVISGEAEQAYASTCGEYLDLIWGNKSSEILRGLEKILAGRTIWISKRHGIVVTAPIASSDEVRVECSGSLEYLTAIGQQLAWLTTILRPVRNDYQSTRQTKLVLSSCNIMCTARKGTFAHLENPCFQIWPNDLMSYPSEDMCWPHLLERAVMAKGYPVPKRGDEVGLELSLGLMLRLGKMTKVSYFEDMLVFSSLSNFIWPSKAYYAEESDPSRSISSVQWHLELLGSSTPLAMADSIVKIQEQRSWERFSEDELQKLKIARCFLGYCARARANLLNLDLSNLKKPRLNKHRSNLTIKILSGQFGTSGLGIFGAEMKFNVSVPQHITVTRKIDDYDTILDVTKTMPIILYDTEGRRAWLIPMIEALLLMVRYWMKQNEPSSCLRREASTALTQDTAFGVLTWNYNTQLRISMNNDKPFLVRDLVKRLWDHASECFTSMRLHILKRSGSVLLGRGKVRGWDLLDIVCPRNTEISALERGSFPRREWQQIADDIPVLMCCGLGDVITPDPGFKLCSEWSTVPRNKEYLTATTDFLRIFRDGAMALTDKTVYSTSPEAFEECTHDTTQSCSKRPQRLLKWRRACEEKTPGCCLPAGGAMVFGV